jgi:hypothetical protein
MRRSISIDVFILQKTAFSHNHGKRKIDLVLAVSPFLAGRMSLAKTVELPNNLKYTQNTPKRLVGMRDNRIKKRVRYCI